MPRDHSGNRRKDFGKFTITSSPFVERIDHVAAVVVHAGVFSGELHNKFCREHVVRCGSNMVDPHKLDILVDHISSLFG